MTSSSTPTVQLAPAADAHVDHEPGRGAWTSDGGASDCVGIGVLLLAGIPFGDPGSLD
jgi:hypothetical protein